jgi:transcriptional regulator with XRE-family HTH domain
MWQTEQARVACAEQEIGAEWAPPHHLARHLMPLADRIRQLRTEAGLSQAELAERAGAGDARQISRYENGRITPSLDAIAHIAQALNISIDYLVIDDMPRRPLHIDDHGLAERLAALAELDQADRDSMLSVLDALITRKRLRTLANDTTAQPA